MDAYLRRYSKGSGRNTDAIHRAVSGYGVFIKITSADKGCDSKAIREKRFIDKSNCSGSL